MLKPFLLIFFVLCAYLCNPAVTTPTNITVDDSEQNIVCLPTGFWNVGQDCKACTARLQPNRTYGNSWHDQSHGVGRPDESQLAFMVFSFIGSAVFVYGVLGFDLGALGTLIKTTQLLLSIDNTSYPMFSFTPSGQTDWTYNASLFAVDSLPHGLHTMVLQNGDPNTSSHVIIDYIVYTTDTNETSSGNSTSSRQSTSNHRAVVAAGVLSGVLGLVAASSALFFYRQQRSNKGANAMPVMDSTTAPPDRFITPYTMDPLPPAGTRQLQGVSSTPSFSATPPPYPASEMDRLAAGDTHPREPQAAGPGGPEVGEDTGVRRLGKLGRLRT